MKIVIGPYTNWIGPYQIADKIFFWVDSRSYCSDEEYDQKMARWDYKLHDRFGDWLAETWVNGLCNWIDSKKRRRIEVHIDRYDTWNMNHTLALIVLPMLKQLRDTKHGSPSTDPEDAPTIGKGEEDEYGSDNKVHERWEWVLNEMIYAFECESNEDWENQFYSGEHDLQWVEQENGLKRMTKGPNDTFKIDYEAMNAARARRENGLRLFGKYYSGLWD